MNGYGALPFDQRRPLITRELFVGRSVPIRGDYCIFIYSETCLERPLPLRDHLSWKTTHFWQKNKHFNTTEPVTRDHLSWETTFLWPRGWSFKTTSTVSCICSTGKLSHSPPIDILDTYMHLDPEVSPTNLWPILCFCRHINIFPAGRKAIYFQPTLEHWDLS